MDNRPTASARYRADLVSFVQPHLREGEQVVGGIALAQGSLPPWFPIVPVIGALAMLTSRYRTYGIVVTSHRFIVVRRAKVRPNRPRLIDVEAPLERVTMQRWAERRSHGSLYCDIDGRCMRFNVVGCYLMDVPDVLAVLRSVPTTNA